MSDAQKANGKYLWWALLSLGFEPEAAVSTAGVDKAMARHTIFGVNMFDKPNKNAFNIVTYFLFKKLNRARAHELFRHCYPVLDRKADAEFRKVTFTWLQEIAVRYGSDFPKVMASLFLSPGGPKFINLMFHLATHVMVQEMKTFSTADGSWVPEAAVGKAHSVETALKRFQMVKNRFLRATVEQDRVIHEYQNKVQTLVKQVRDLRAEEAKYDNLLKHCENDIEQEQNSLMQKVHKVRSLWADVNRMLSSLEEERKVVDCVIKGNVDQYVLDGTDRSLKVPRVLLERMESTSLQKSDTGNIYVAGQLNILRLLELLNDSLHVLQQERHSALRGGPAPKLDLQHLQDQAQLLNRSLEAFRLTRRKITKEDIPEVKGSIQEMQATWEKKWADCLKKMPLVSFLKNDPALEFLSPMAPLSFEPATEATFKSSIFSQYPAKLPAESLSEVHSDRHPDLVRNEDKKDADPESCSCPAAQLNETLPKEPSQPSTPCRNPVNPSVPQQAPSPRPVQTSILKHASTRDARPKMASSKKKAVILDRECDNLADQLAEAVATNTSWRQQELEELLQTLPDPFSARKQLPRTPESLISEVKRSWRRAVEEGEAEKARLSMQFAEAHKETSPGSSNFIQAGEGAPAQPQLPEISVVDGNTLPPQQGFDSLHSTLSWHSSHMHASNSLSSSDVIQFGIDQETMPESLGNGSFLSCSDGDPGEEVLSLPEFLPSSLEPQSARTNLRAIQETYSDSSFLDWRPKVPGSPMPQCNEERSAEAEGWEVADKVFSLDLDALESPSRSSPERFSFPKLVTFSPVEEFLGP
ncbi:HAUS augmin-like complex subunit 6 isoform X1 [Arapaima gigas]